MIMAFIIWVLGKAGVEATPERFMAWDRSFRERGHHLIIDFGATRFDGTRWTGDNFEKLITIGLGYEYLIDRKYNGVGFEVLGQVLGPVFRPNRQRHEYFVGGGIDYYPISPLRVFMQAGANILDTGHTEALGRVGLGWRIMFFNVGVQPHAYVQANTAGIWSWAIAARFEY